MHIRDYMTDCPFTVLVKAEWATIHPTDYYNNPAAYAYWRNTINAARADGHTVDHNGNGWWRIVPPTE